MSFELSQQKLQEMKGANCFFRLPKKPEAQKKCDHLKIIRAIEILLAQGHWGMFRMVHGTVAHIMLTPNPSVSQIYQTYRTNGLVFAVGWDIA
jgi:hypothetical protein